MAFAYIICNQPAIIQKLYRPGRNGTPLHFKRSAQLRVIAHFTPIFVHMTHFHNVHLDRTEIKTIIRLHPDFRANPKSYIEKNDLSIRTCRPWLGTKAGCKTWNVRLDVLTYRGISVELRQSSGSAFADAKIHFNPGVCLYGHNGRTLTLQCFIHALVVLAMHLRPLLANTDDWTDLIPGVKRGGLAYWSYLEVPFQCFDPTGRLLAAFRSLRHPKIKSPTRHWPSSTT